ncbi:lipoprotein-attachment site-containing protein [Rhodoferax sp. OV413]|nr:lipoprotein-attachment site-containing protein [Rhodoferax sp. OV413]
MLKLIQILVSPVCLAGVMVVLGGCGQKGDLYHPAEAAAARRATLPQTLTPEALKPAVPASAP